MNTFLLVVILCACYFLCSCAGYHLGGAKPSEFVNIHSIAVPQFENYTLEPRLSSLVTNSTVDALSQDGTYRISQIGEADATLVATIRVIDYRQYRANRLNVLTSDELLASLMVEWKLVKNGRTLGQGTARGKTNFFVGDNLQLSRENALPVAASRAAQQIVTSLTDGF
jgi:hypothetical protein